MLKTSWIQASAIPPKELQSYYTRKALIKTNNTATVTTVALTGMHVVGVVKNHPEFIWATFEHNTMAAKYDWAATTNQDVPVTSDQDLLFFSKSAHGSFTDIYFK